MNARISLIILAFVGIFLIVAGCTQPAVPPATPTPTAVPTGTPSTAPTVATPAVTPTLEYIEGPLPSQYQVDVNIDRNRVATDPFITVEYRGGKGINFVSAVDVIVTRSDGQVIQKTMVQPMVNDVVKIDGTRGTDRVEVYVFLVTGDRYRIADELLPFRSYN